MARTPHSIYVLYEPEQQFLAERIDNWQRTDLDPERHACWRGAPPDEAEAALRAEVESALARADVVVCLVSLTAADDPWITCELCLARNTDPRKPLVGILLNEFNEPPPAMANAGAVFVPFKRDTVDRGIKWAFEMRAVDDDYTLKDF